MSLNQALLGAVSEELTAAGIQVHGEVVVVHFWVRRRSEEVIMDIEDILASFDAFLTEDPSRIEWNVHDGFPLQGNQGWPGRLAYLAKRNDSSND